MINKVGQFIQGNYRLLLDKEFNALEPHIKEQVEYRASICTDCMEAGECKFCGCQTPGKLYVTKSCNNGERFPDLMGLEDWNKFKIENNVKPTVDLPSSNMGG